MRTYKIVSDGVESGYVLKNYTQALKVLSFLNKTTKKTNKIIKNI